MAAQRSDPVLSQIISQLESNQSSPNNLEWTQFPLKRYKQLWSQLTISSNLLCRKVSYPVHTEERLLILVPKSERNLFLQHAHEQSGHQGIDRTLARLSEVAYWPGMGRDVIHHCQHCTKCQLTKSPERPPAPLQPVITSKPWELVAVDILKLPMSSKGNQYLLVAQDYFSKWPFARALPDQRAQTIVQTLRDDVFSLVGPPQKLHSDQGRNFESHLLRELCKAFGVKKSHTTPYHPMGDGLVERMNRSLLSLLRSHAQRESDWEEHLQLLLYLYRTSKHASTGLPPYEILFGHNPPSLFTPPMPGAVLPEPCEYSKNLHRKVTELRELVEANLVESTERQRRYYAHYSKTPTKLNVGQQILLNNAVRGKLDPRWTGPWEVMGLKGATTVRLKMGNSERTVHINRVRPLLTEPGEGSEPGRTWTPPLFHHETQQTPSAPRPPELHEDPRPPTPNPQVQVHQPQTPADAPVVPVTTRSGRAVRPVQRYGWT